MSVCDHPQGLALPDCPLRCLGLRPTVANPLRSAGVGTVGDLVVGLVNGEVADFRQVGSAALREIRAALVACGIVENADDDGIGEPARVLAWVVREYYENDAEAALVDLAWLAGLRA